MNHIQENIQKIEASIPDEVTLVAVSKTKPVSDIEKAYDAGCRDFGENKVQELLAKEDVLPKDIRWHMIGHLQSKKVKSIVGHTYLIHAVDTEKLLAEINKRAKAKDLVVNCLLQVHIAEEESKYGFTPDEVNRIVRSGILEQYPSVRVKGLMAMASNTSDTDQVHDEFRIVKNLFMILKRDVPALEFDTLSMGMSGDYHIAIEEGSNMVRVGSGIFGAR